MGSELPHQNLLLTCKPYWVWADLQTTIALQANNYWFGGQTAMAVALPSLPFRACSLVALLAIA